MAKVTPIIDGDAFLQWLSGAGIIPNTTRRVVIDACVGEALMLYIEQYGTKSFIDLEPPAALINAVQVSVLGIGESKNG